MLAGLLTRPDFAHTIVLQPSDFSSDSVGAIFEAIRRVPNATPPAITGELNRLGKPVDASFLSTLFALKPDQVDQADLEHYAGEVRKDGTRRRLMGASQRAVDLLRDGHMDEAQTVLSRAMLNATDEMIAGEEPTAQAIVERMNLEDGEGAYFKSGLDIIDAATGGMRHGHVWIITAPYKGRKTTVALHCCLSALEQGKSVAYVALEDDDVAFTQALMAMAGDFHVKFFELRPEHRPPEINDKMTAAFEWIKDKKFRVYDAKKGVHNFNNVPQIIRSDKLKYDTDLVVVDYVQAWGEEYEVISPVAQKLAKTAQECSVCILELSQVSGETIRNGSSKRMLATKGSQTFGGTCHVGIELRYDKDRAPRKQHIVRFPHDLGSAAEIGVHMKIARRAPNTWNFLLINPESGKVFDQQPMPVYPSKMGEID